MLKFFLIISTFIAIFCLLFFLIENPSSLILADKSISTFNCSNYKFIIKEKIIILNETTHGSESIREVKNCSIKNLIENNNFDSIVLEFDFSTINVLNSYVNNDNVFSGNDIRKIFEGSFYFSVSLFELIEWVKIKNTKNIKKIYFLGMDNDNSIFVLDGILKSKNYDVRLKNCIRQNNLIIGAISENCTAYFIKYFSKTNPNFFGEDYFIVSLKRILSQLNKQNTRDFNMFNTFKDIYQSYPDRKFIISTHSGHGLNFPNQFGSFLQSSGLNTKNYIFSVCSGTISSYRDIDRSMYILKVSQLDNDLIESSLCKNKNPDFSKNTRILNYLNKFATNYSIELPDYSFDGFIVIKESKPLNPPSK